MEILSHSELIPDATLTLTRKRYSCTVRFNLLKKVTPFWSAFHEHCTTNQNHLASLGVAA